MPRDQIRRRRVSVHALVRDTERGIALSAVPTRSGDLRWGLPGGVLGHGESPETVLARDPVSVPMTPAVSPRLLDAVTEVSEPPDSDGLLHTVRLLYHLEDSRWDGLPEDSGIRWLRPDRGPTDLPLLDYTATALGMARTGLTEDIHPAVAVGDDESPAQVQRVAAYAVVVADRGILMTRLAQTRRWTLPGGGIEFGEQPVAAVRRELVEETSLRLEREQLVGVGSAHFTGRAPNGRQEDFHAVRIFYRGQITAEDEPTVLEVGGSTDAAAWIPLSDLGRLPLTHLVPQGLSLVRPDLLVDLTGPDPAR